MMKKREKIEPNYFVHFKKICRRDERELNSGFPNFANKTFANWTFANGESPQGVLARVRWTFANWRKSGDVLAKVQ
jgi:hypothetical protein